MRIIEILREANMPQDVVEYYKAQARLNEIIEIPSDGEIRDLTEILKCLSNPIRLKIIAMLSKPHCVCVLTKALGYDITLISHHLTRLKECNLVRVEPLARARIYARNEEFLREFISCLMKMFLT